MPVSAPDFNHNAPVYSISEISLSIKRVLEDHFGVVRLRGEVSGWKGAHSSGHAYFSLKDEQAVINAVCWKGTLGKLQHKPEEGLEVIATGRISAYNGKYQLIVEHVEPAGAGALMALLEKRRKQFEGEGLFADSRKKPLPFLPQIIGVITSPTGAVIRDILHRLSDRFPVHVIVWPVAVQGEGAKEQIAEAINGFNSPNPQSPIPKPDLLIVARGGGSIEDLWAFNEEIVVRAAAGSNIPLISAVGHETDTTLIDFVADRRAPTPTAAAEMAVPVREELLMGIREFESRLRIVATRLFENITQRVDDWSERLLAALPQMLARKEQQLAVLAASLQPRVLYGEIKTLADKLNDWQKRMHLSAQRLFDRQTATLTHLAAMLESVNYQKILERGFALVRDEKGKLVSSAASAKKSSLLSLMFTDGELKVKP
jgi:exodeoxyribonuclease VII large subunit